MRGKKGARVVVEQEVAAASGLEKSNVYDD